MSNDEAWMIMLLLLCSVQEQGKEISLIDLEQKRADVEFVNNCPSVEWEQDMGAHIPFCKLDNEMCNMQCKDRNFHNSYNAEKSDFYKKE